MGKQVGFAEGVVASATLRRGFGPMFADASLKVQSPRDKLSLELCM